MGRLKSWLWVSIAIWIWFAWAAIVLVPNPNIPFVDDLAIEKLFLLAPFTLGLGAVLLKLSKGSQVPYLGTLLICALMGSYHSSALLFQFGAPHDLSVVQDSSDRDDGIPRTIEGSQGYVSRTREFPNGSGSYVMESLQSFHGDEPVQTLDCVYAGNQPNGILPNWIVPLRVKPWSFEPQYWVQLNQYRKRNSLLLAVNEKGIMRSQWFIFLAASVFLSLLPWLVALKTGKRKVAIILVLFWLLAYQPWNVFLW